MGHVGRNRHFDLMLMHFVGMWILTVIGVLFAILLPFSVVILLSIISIGFIIITFLMRLSSVIIYLIPFLLGILHFLVLILLIELFGAALIVSVFIGTVIIFLLIAFVGLKLIAQFPGGMIYLFTVLIVFTVFAFIFIFIPVNSTFFLVLAGLIVLAFALYTVYELDLICHNHIRESEIILLALKLYLNLAYLVIEIILSSKRFRH